ncbi:MAG: hypothetical protein ACRC2R_27520 [Xenococcaceae cyanobacterium]
MSCPAKHLLESVDKADGRRVNKFEETSNFPASRWQMADGNNKKKRVKVITTN